MLYVILRYFETGARKYLYLLAIALVIHFIDKETSFMYAAMLLLFLAVYFIARVTRNAWHDVFSVSRLHHCACHRTLIIWCRHRDWNRRTNTGILGATEVASPAIPSAAAPLQSTSGAASPATLLLLAEILALIGADIS